MTPPPMIALSIESSNFWHTNFGISSISFSLLIITKLSMIDELTDQFLDMIFTNNKIKERMYPIFYCIVGFNVILLLLVIYIAIKVSRTSKL